MDALAKVPGMVLTTELGSVVGEVLAAVSIAARIKSSGRIAG